MIKKYETTSVPQIAERYRACIDIIKNQHKFWDTMPIMKLRKKDEKKGQIVVYDVEKVSKDPINLPEGFVWKNIDINDDLSTDEVCIFMNQHYIEDDEGKVRMYYNREQVRYTVQSPGFIQELHFCVRNAKNNKIMALIFGTPKRLIIQGETVKIAEINFLAIHKNLRGKKMAQVMI